jgi:subtilisin family serine protease
MFAMLPRFGWLLLMLAAPPMAVPASPAESAASGPILYNGLDVRAACAGQAPAREAASGDWLVIEPAGGARPEARQDLERSGFEIVAPLPPSGYLVLAKEREKASAWLSSDSKRATLAAAVRPEWKIDAALRETVIPADRAGELVSLMASASALTPELRAAIKAAGGIISSESLTPEKPRLGLKVEAGRLSQFLETLAQRPEVYSLDVAGGAKLLNDGAAPLLQSGSAAGGHPIWNRGIRGEGQVIAVLDTGIDYDSCFFAEADGSPPPVMKGLGQGAPDFSRRKVVMVNLLFSADSPSDPTDFDSNGHGTAVSGDALGSRLADPFGTDDLNGMAPAAQLVTQDGGYAVDNCSDLPALQCPVVDLTPHMTQALKQGVHIHNNSWGDRENFFPQNTYTAPTADMDEAMWFRPDFLVVCAAGNSGPGPDSVGSPSIGKNGISVAATNNPSAGGDPETLTNFSSRGWAADGRIKPDLAVPGIGFTANNDFTITSNNCNTRSFSGTSMASPILAGCAALVRQYYVDGWSPTGTATPAHGFIPSNALIKATLINGAEDMTGATGFPPNRAEGWGRVHLENSLYFDGDFRRVLAADLPSRFQTSKDQPFEARFQANGNAAGGLVKISLAWADYPGNPAAGQALVNNLDLTVTAQADGTVYRGNSFDGATGFSQPNASLPDTINNVEMVVLPANATGEYLVRVSPTNIIEASQGFALVIGGDVEAVATPTAANAAWKLYQ